jgi:hypothetical protein
MTLAPPLSNESMEAGRKQSLAVRQERVQLKARIKRGEITFSEALDHPAARKMEVRQLARAVPRLGKPSADAILEAIGLPSGKKVGALGSVQRRRLLARISEATAADTRRG